MNEGGDGHFHRSVTTNESGVFKATGLRAGSYIVQAHGSGHYAKDAEGARKKVSVKLGEHTGGVDFPLSRGVVIAGKVVDVEGQPIGGIQVMCYGKSGGRGSSSRRETGAFGVRVAPGDGYRVCAFTSDLVSQVHGPVDVGAGGVSGIVLRLQPAARISGRIVDGKGRLIPEARLRLAAVDTVRVDNPEGRGRKQAPGEFDEYPLAPGTYRVSVDLIRARGGYGGIEEAEPSEITVASGQHLSNLVIKTAESLTAELSISGRVTDARGAPIANANVRVNGFSVMRPPFGGQAQTDEEGRYEVEGLPEGDCRVDVSCQGRYSSVWRGEIATGSRNVDFVLEGLAAIEGKVVRADTGAPVKEFEVMERPSRGEVDLSEVRSFNNRILDEEGRFRLENIGVGRGRRFAVVARAPGLAPGYTLTDVIPEKTVEGVVVRLSPCPVLMGTIRGAEGEAVAGAQFFLGEFPHQPSFGGGRHHAALAVSESDGAFKIESLEANIFDLCVFHSDHAPLVAPVAIPDGASEQRLDLAFPAGGVIEGVVRRGETPLAKQQITLKFEGEAFRDYQPSERVETDDEGRYRLDKLPPGEMDVIASLVRVEMEGNVQRHMGLGQVTRKAIVAAGGVTVVDFDAPGDGGVIEGRITFFGSSPEHAGVFAVSEQPEGRTLLTSMAKPGDGTYRFEEVPAGTVELYVQVATQRHERFGKHVAVEMAQGETRTQDIAFDGTGVLTGSLSGEFSREAYLVLVPGRVDAAGLMDSPEDLMRITARQAVQLQPGAFRLEGLDPGVYTLVAGTDGLVQMDSEVVEIPATGEVSVDLVIE